MELANESNRVAILMAHGQLICDFDKLKLDEESRQLSELIVENERREQSRQDLKVCVKFTAISYLKMPF